MQSEMDLFVLISSFAFCWIVGNENALGTDLSPIACWARK